MRFGLWNAMTVSEEAVHDIKLHVTITVGSAMMDSDALGISLHHADMTVSKIR